MQQAIISIRPAKSLTNINSAWCSIPFTIRNDALIGTQRIIPSKTQRRAFPIISEDEWPTGPEFARTSHRARHRDNNIDGPIYSHRASNPKMDSGPSYSKTHTSSAVILESANDIPSRNCIQPIAEYTAADVGFLVTSYSWEYQPEFCVLLADLILPPDSLGVIIVCRNVIDYDNLMKMRR